MRKSLILIASVSLSGLVLGGCASSLTGDTYSRSEARTVQLVRMGTIESLRPVRIEGTKTPIGSGAGAVVGGIAGSGVGGGRGSAVAAVIGAVATGISLVLTVACLEAEYRHGLRPTTRALWLLYLPLIVPLMASIAVAVIFSLINGFGVSKLKMHAFIITLGTQLIAFGANCLFIEAQPSGTAQALSTFNQTFKDVAAGDLMLGTFKIPLVVLYFLSLAAIMWVVWNKTRLGKNMFAVGGNEEAARVSGVNVVRTIMVVYLIAGVLYGIAAFLEAARIQSVGANTGLGYETDAISACVIGGVSFTGGVGTNQGDDFAAIDLN